MRELKESEKVQKYFNRKPQPTGMRRERNH
ncbi:CLUMA_CG012635, isoform A [Clunio marinus]|uniref:CLUMA_CG012635, isoform A n=1 Tax=Clunio marinus TaxID=568069 RepID=A0A1J1IIK3_9DIPT|nr:CLUMA_CG012635, isoform A [Clunio marinus]